MDATTMDTLQLDDRLNALILEGKNLEAFRTLYDPDVVAQENDEAERVGLESWIQMYQAMAQNIEGGTVRLLANAANGDVSFSEWENELVFKGGQAMKMVQVAVRRWKNGRVVRERFYHK